jgi:hypothetical protein
MPGLDDLANGLWQWLVYIVVPHRQFVVTARDPAQSRDSIQE